MKTKSLLHLAVLFLSTLTLRAAGLGAPQRHGDAASNSSVPDYTVVERGPHHRVIRGTTIETNFLDNRTIIRTNSFTYTELETGMHRKISKGELVEASDGIALAPGGAATTNSAHEVFFAANANSTTALRVTMPDGKTTLKSHVLWLTYFDRETGSNAIVAELTDSIGQIISANEVLYTNALVGDCVADILYHNTKAGIEQNIILRSQPPDPAEYGIANATLQVWSEFVSGPKPRKFASNSRSGDEQLDFGAMKIGPGEAFAIDGDSRGRIPVHKQWVELEGRTFLVEQVPVEAVTTELQELPGSSTGGGGGQGGGRGAHGSIQRRLPNVRFAETSTNAMQVAQLGTKPRPGFLLDYNMTSATNFIFQADTTYYVSGSIYLAGSNVFEGGSVIKYETNAAINVYPIGSTNILTFLGAAYRPTIFTAKDDQTVGAIISGSSNAPSGYYANSALVLWGFDQASPIARIRIAYARQGILAPAGGTGDIVDAQFVNCSNPLKLTGATVHLRNVLIANCQTNINCVSGVTLSAEHVTFSGCNYFTVGPSGPNGSTITLTNCILADITNRNAGVVAITGDTNGVWNSTLVGMIVTNTTYPFQTVGGASFYLANGCAFRDAGTTNFNSGLLSNLAQKTTYPPIVIPTDIITNNMALSPQAQRDFDIPDLGYHYDPLDYAFKLARFTNSTLSLSPGTAIATIANYGIALWSGGQFVSTGTPTNLNHVTRYNMVQENSNTNWDGKGASFLDNWFGGSVIPNFSARFTDFTMPAQDGNHLQIYYSGENAFLTDCQLHGGKIYVGAPNINLTNCLFERVQTAIGDDAGVVSPIVRNCLFFGGTIYLDHWESGVWVFRDNLFDNPVILQSEGVDMDAAYNAYTMITNHVTPTNVHDILLSSTDYRAGPLGSYYYPTNGGKLSTLVNAGSTNAALVGLYHYTVTTNLISGLQIKETNSVVDIGFHYVAVDSTGRPIDTDGDSLADYYEDTNGDGTYNGGDVSDWTDYYNGVVPTLSILRGDGQGGMPSGGSFLFLPMSVVVSRGGAPLNNAPVTFGASGTTIATTLNGSTAASQSLRTDSNGIASVFALAPSGWDSTASVTATGSSGAGNGQVSFAAKNVSTPRLWLKADAGVSFASGNSVNWWQDQSGNTNNAWQFISDRYPVQTNDVLNHKPVLNFTPYQTMYMSNFPSGLTQAEAFVMMRTTHYLPLDSSPPLGFSAYFAGEAYPIADGFGSSLASYPIGFPNLRWDQFHLYDALSSTNEWTLRLNGKLYFTAPNSSVYFSSTPMIGYAGNYFLGDIAEILMFDRTLSREERDGVGFYFNNTRYAWVAPPPTPAGLSAFAISPNQVSLVWTNSQTTNVLVYLIERKVPGGCYSQVGVIRDGSSFVDNTAIPGATNIYRIITANYAGISSYSAEASVVTPVNGTLFPYTDLVLWLKADAGIVLNSSNNIVSFWLDQSGQTNYATVARPTDPTFYQPALADSALNGRPVVDFDGGYRHFYFPNFPATLKSAEGFIVLRASSPGGFWQFGTDSQSGYPDAFGHITDDFGRAASVNFGTPLQHLDQYHLYNVYTAPWRWTSRINGRVYGSTDNDVPVFQLYQGSARFGYTTGVAGANYFHGDVAEILLFNKILSREEREAVGTYLNRKYAFLSTAPPVPGGLTATGLRPYEIQVAWTNTLVTNGLTYTIERKTGTSGVYAPIMVLPDLPYYVDTGAFPGTNFGYRVKSWNFNGYSAYSSEVLTPAVVITNPQPQSVFSTGTNIVVGATAVPGAGSISKVDFYVNRKLYATVMSAPYTITITNLTFGASTVAAKATDSLGNSAFSAHVVVIVSPDTDGDGFSDYAEIQAGTDPNNPLSYPYTPPGDPSDHTPPTIFLDEPSNATLLP